MFLPQSRESYPPCTSKESSLKLISDYKQLLKHKSKRLQTTQAQTQESSYAQAQKQESSKQTQLHKNMFEVEHLIYNQWCSQYKSDTDSKISKIWKLLRNFKWTLVWNNFSRVMALVKLLWVSYNLQVFTPLYRNVKDTLRIDSTSKRVVVEAW
jgi:hypothetical protein